jgi:hypothetical protein
VPLVPVGQPVRPLVTGAPPAADLPRRADVMRRCDGRDAGRGVAMTEHAVVIAGGGPTGLMPAGELALAGVDVAIVERRASQDLPGSRAGDPQHARSKSSISEESPVGSCHRGKWLRSRGSPGSR